MRVHSLLKRPTKSIPIPYTNILSDIQRKSIGPDINIEGDTNRESQTSKDYIRSLFNNVDTAKKTSYKDKDLNLWKPGTVKRRIVKDPNKWKLPTPEPTAYTDISTVESKDDTSSTSNDTSSFEYLLDICKNIPKTRLQDPSLKPKEQFNSININDTPDHSSDAKELISQHDATHIQGDILSGRYAHLSSYRNETVRSLFDKGGSITENVNNLIKERGLRGELKECLSMLSEMKDYGIEVSTETYNNILIGCMKLKDPKTARYLYLSLRSDSLSPDLKTYTLMIKTHIMSDDLSSGFSLYRKMEKDGIKADLVIYTVLIDGLIMRNYLSNAWRLYNYMRTWRLIEPDEVLFTIMIKSCIPGRNAEKAMNLYDEMLQLKKYPTYHTYKELIHCLSYRREYFYKCFQLYNQIKAEEHKITPQIILHLLRACETSGNVRKAKELIAESERLQIEMNEEMYITLIKVFAKQIGYTDMSENEKINCIRKVWQIVHGMIQKKISVTTKLLNSIIIVYDNGKYHDYALDVLTHFGSFNVEPDHMTYFILLRMLGPKLQDPGRFFVLWNVAKTKIEPQKTLMCMALEMAILSKSAKRTLEVLNEMYLAKIFPTPSLMKKLYDTGKNITQIHLMINNLVTLQRRVTFEEKTKEQKMIQTYIDEHSLKMSRDGIS